MSQFCGLHSTTTIGQSEKSAKITKLKKNPDLSQVRPSILPI